MAYVSKKMYAILQSKANQGDKRVVGFLHQLTDMKQEEAEAQIRMFLKDDKSGIETNDVPEEEKPNNEDNDPIAERARELVDSGEFEDYDDAYNLLTKQNIKKRSTENEVTEKMNKLPEMYDSDDILIDTLTKDGFEVVRLEKDKLVINISGNEYSLPIERDEEKIKIRKEIK